MQLFTPTIANYIASILTSMKCECKLEMLLVFKLKNIGKKSHFRTIALQEQTLLFDNVRHFNCTKYKKLHGVKFHNFLLYDSTVLKS